MYIDDRCGRFYIVRHDHATRRSIGPEPDEADALSVAESSEGSPPPYRP
jgi:hypothetical protein